ncbi:glycerol-3-phosphate acyltransferase 1, mitochondrial-like isoform X1 [Orbicella faveolata]|uniref:glycerol-3-phosphate acyltransferase 1, mitochondrial-like isoform X1 n=1 Tax=Orbicella faveolata TaxID=48498 RepID=UPI0009E2A6D6|nr:glycerol-3-phosphate acyltransferase 1, mitochondrial-like isoform X1 [Orbicella faveolata]
MAESEQLDMDKMDAVYKKWEARSSGPTSSGNYRVGASNDTQQTAWQRDNLQAPIRQPSKYRARKRKPKQEDYSFQPLTEIRFHVPAAVVPSIYKRRRPFMGEACNRCCRESKKLYEEMMPSWGMHNVLSMDRFRKQNLLKRSFCHIVFMWERDISHQYPSVKRNVQESARVKTCSLTPALQEPASSAQDMKTAEKERRKKIDALEKEAVNILNGMAAVVYRKFVRFTAWFLFKVFGRLLSSVQIHKGQIDILREASQDEKPLVFLPLHKSHMDYLLLTFVLVTCDIKVPHVAAGDNLRIPFFSWILRHLGGFFIKRKLDHSSGKDDLYKCILQEYVEQLLQNGQYLEFYIEGSRSRTGKAMVPKSGLLSLVVNSVTEGTVPDVNIVPVNISYEKVVDSGYTRELLGEQKRPESFWNTMKSIWRVLRTRYGNVRLDFGQPFSLQEFSRAMDLSHPMKDFADNLVSKATVTSTPRSSLLRNNSDVSLEDVGDDKCFTLTKALGYHVIYDAVNCCAVMSTNMVAFLLLNSHRKGTTFEDLCTSFEWLQGEITSHGRDVGFTGKTAAVIRHALRLLEDDVAVTESQKDSENAVQVHVQPKLVLPHVLNLVFYSNQIVSVFALDAVLACGIIAAAEDSESYDTDDIEGQKIVSQSSILEKAKHLCEILQREFIFVRPCVSLESALSERLEKFTASETLKIMATETSTVGARGSQWGWDDEDEDMGGLDAPEIEYKLTTYEEQLKRLQFLKSVVAPLVESYWVSACGLLWLRNQRFSDTEFLSALHTCAKERVQKEVTLFPESFSLEPFRNAVRVFRDWKVIQVDAEGGLTLCDAYNNEDAVFDVIEKISQFKL